MEVIIKILPIILKAKDANDVDLRLLRHKLFELLDEIGPRCFVTEIADILKNNFRIEGCNDARISLKSIFRVSLEELEEVLQDKDYGLPKEHPLTILSCDHRENISKLKALDSTFGDIKKITQPEQLINNLKIAKGYYKELDSHIKKEEDVLFPVLERYGMKEHPDNLREEHKGFRQIIVETIEALERLIQEKSVLTIETITKFKEKFIPDISNHIFRETYIFYPAALEFITDANEWDDIKEKFNLVPIS